jgi:hypothetical protein
LLTNIAQLLHTPGIQIRDLKKRNKYFDYLRAGNVPAEKQLYYSARSIKKQMVLGGGGIGVFYKIAVNLNKHHAVPMISSGRLFLTPRRNIHTPKYTILNEKACKK